MALEEELAFKKGDFVTSSRGAGVVTADAAKNAVTVYVRLRRHGRVEPLSVRAVTATGHRLKGDLKEGSAKAKRTGGSDFNLSITRSRGWKY
jgi:hypothetical protein